MRTVIQVKFDFKKYDAVYVFNFEPNESQELTALAKELFKKFKINTTFIKETLILRPKNEYILIYNKTSLKTAIINSKSLINNLNREKKRDKQNLK